MQMVLTKIINKSFKPCFQILSSAYGSYIGCSKTGTSAEQTLTSPEHA